MLRIYHNISSYSRNYCFFRLYAKICGTLHSIYPCLNYYPIKNLSQEYSVYIKIVNILKLITDAILFVLNLYLENNRYSTGTTIVNSYDAQNIFPADYIFDRDNRAIFIRAAGDGGESSLADYQLRTGLAKQPYQC